MKIPNFVDHKFVNDDGFLTDSSKQMLNQLFTEMQNNLSDEGHKLPQQDTTTITKLNTNLSKGALLYNSDTDKLVVNINGTFKDVTTS